MFPPQRFAKAEAKKTVFFYLSAGWPSCFLNWSDLLANDFA